jgi:uncharacterized membrane-anchored protein YjiN (DUF445 family)
LTPRERIIDLRLKEYQLAEIKKIEKLDAKLMESGIIKEEFKKDYNKIHTLLNDKVKRGGKSLTEDVFEQGNGVLREWLSTQAKRGAAQEKLTSYIRCGLAHLCFDFVQSQDKNADTGSIVTRALQSFKKRKYDKSYYKPGG